MGFSTDQFEITEKAIFGGKLRSGKAAKRRNFTVFEDLNSLNVEDLVVHIDYGIESSKGLKILRSMGLIMIFLK